MRNILLIKTAFNTWLRMSELLSIKVSDIRTDTPFYIKGKWGKERLVDINPELREEMLAYVGYTSKVNRNQGRIIYKSETGFVFINHSDNHYGKQLCSQSASTIIKKLCDDMRLYHWWTKYWTMHTLRHSYASQAVKDWVHIVVLKELMGHEDIRTTNWYTHVDAKFLMEQLYKIQKVI
jgi:integrase/recombinase XerD